ncbi:speckle-type POZ protein-like B [Caerostris darwini]|uniref:Speckle-type POZ protein-like B n=1 Tax=Caerostris darwini TaxID=1538125 RepID=A0AAV4S7P3_9ARAC|nr:speckle-type POZ protein-like B [Caerostris darwini]
MSSKNMAKTEIFPIYCKFVYGSPLSQHSYSIQIPETQILNLNNEWTVKFSPLPNKFDIEVSRKSTIKTADITGILEQRQGEHIINHFSFEHFFTKGSTSTLIALPLKSISFADIVLTGTITIKSENFTTEMSESDEVIQHKSWEELSNNFKRLLNPEVSYFSDVSFICGSVTIPAHKSILSARSPIFADVFTAQMKENIENKVHITDMEVPILRAMLVHIYTGKTEDLSIESSGDLLVAADKYQLEDLKRVCCNFLKRMWMSKMY